MFKMKFLKLLEQFFKYPLETIGNCFEEKLSSVKMQAVWAWNYHGR